MNERMYVLCMYISMYISMCVSVYICMYVCLYVQHYQPSCVKQNTIFAVSTYVPGRVQAEAQTAATVRRFTAQSE